jgi:NTE family protein
MTGRIGLVLGSGGLAGTAFHAGVLTALWRVCGWDARDAHVVVGTSAGSTSAALLRAGLPPDDFVARMTMQRLSAEGERVVRGMPPRLTAPTPDPARERSRRWAPASPELLRRVARRPWSARPGGVVSAALPAGRISTEEVRSPFEGVFESWPEQALWICALRLSDGRRTVFGRDGQDDRRPSVGAAVAASCAIPGYFSPVSIGGERYVDGGAYSLCNADLLAGEGLEAVIVSAPMSTSDRLHPSRDHVWRSAARGQLAMEVRQISRAGTPVLVLHPQRADRQVMAGAGLDASRRPAIARQVLASVSRILRQGHPVLDVLR